MTLYPPVKGSFHLTNVKSAAGAGHEVYYPNSLAVNMVSGSKNASPRESETFPFTNPGSLITTPTSKCTVFSHIPVHSIQRLIMAMDKFRDNLLFHEKMAITYEDLVELVFMGRKLCGYFSCIRVF